jgi:cation transport regulator
MPYRDNSDLPATVRDHLPAEAQDIFRAAFNSAYQTQSNDDDAAFRIAWAAVERSYVKEGGQWVPRGVPG